MDIDISGNLDAFLHRRSPDARYASFDYCFNYFQQARERGQATVLADEECLELSCLHLGFYLASWGMMRGSGGLHRRSLWELAPVVRAIAVEPPESWELDVRGYTGVGARAVLSLADRIRAAFSVLASDVLVSKTMLGVFGCVPAFDRYFRIGFGPARLNSTTLGQISAFYAANASTLDAFQIPTLDFTTRQDTSRRYTQAKIIDMIFFEEGYKRSGQRRL
jgi:hypothetical protein